MHANCDVYFLKYNSSYTHSCRKAVTQWSINKIMNAYRYHQTVFQDYISTGERVCSKDRAEVSLNNTSTLFSRVWCSCSLFQTATDWHKYCHNWCLCSSTLSLLCSPIAHVYVFVIYTPNHMLIIKVSLSSLWMDEGDENQWHIWFILQVLSSAISPTCNILYLIPIIEWQYDL